MSGRTGEARWPGCPQAERLARQRSASLDPFEADPRSGRIGKPEDSQGTVSRSDRKTTRRNDKLISKKLFLFDSNNDRLVYKTSKHCSRHQTKRRRRRKTVFWDKFIFKIAARLCPYGPPW
jgi:hypothetical protein